MSNIRIEDWCLRSPHPDKVYLEGVVYGHPEHADGHRVTTSRITFYDIERHEMALTRSGHFYKLGKPERDFVEWLEHDGIPSAVLLRARLGP